jgi:hypothetical protein
VSDTQARLDAIGQMLCAPYDAYDAADWCFAANDLAAELERVTAAAKEAGEAADFFGAFTTPDAVTVPSLQLQRLVKAAWEVRRAALAGGARAAQEPPHPDETDDVPHPAAHADTLPCGHPRSAVVSADEGTSYCGGCAQENERSES